MTEYTYTAVIEYDAETEQYVGIIPGLTGAHTFAPSLDELHERLKEVVELVLEDMREHGEEIPVPLHVGTQTVSVKL